MATASFKDETSVVDVMKAGSSGSFDFGGSTPSASTCVCSVDGVGLNNGGNIGDGLVSPTANDRATGSATTSGGGFGNVTITTSLSQYAVISTDQFDLNDVSSISVKLFSQSVGSFVVQSYKFLSGSFTYSYM
jgi:hypothetical protein